jgi:hypothetical protein
LGFGPFGGSDAGGQEAWVGFAGVECSLTAGTDDRWCGVGLTAEELREQFLGEHFPELVEEVFNGREAVPRDRRAWWRDFWRRLPDKVGRLRFGEVGV